MKIENIEISHPDKIMYPKDQLTKKNIAEYYAKISSYLLPYVKDRPITMRRYPDGIEEDGFYNKHIPDYFPDFIRRLSVPMKKDDSYMEMVGAEESRDLVYLADQNTIELHVALAKVSDIDKPDQIIFDFDPSDDDFEKVRRAALAFKDLLDDSDLISFVKTTGSRGVHIHIPVEVNYGFQKVKAMSKKMAEKLHDKCSEITTLEQRKGKRGDKVFIDYLRNDYGMTAIAPYSLRAKPKAPIAVPLDWEELKDKSIGPRSFNLSNIFRRLGQKQDPWADFYNKRKKNQLNMNSI